MSCRKNSGPIQFRKIGRYTVLLLLLHYSAPGLGQQGGGYLSLDAGIYFMKQFDPGIGIHFSGNAVLQNEVYLGAEFGVIKFDQLDDPYLPLLLRFSALPALGSGRIRGLILLAPGYGLYDEKFRVGNSDYHSKGGFCFYGGVGAVIPGKKRGSLMMSLGYSTFGFNTNDHKSNIDGLGLRIGAMFR